MKIIFSIVYFTLFKNFEDASIFFDKDYTI